MTWENAAYAPVLVRLLLDIWMVLRMALRGHPCVPIDNSLNFTRRQRRRLAFAACLPAIWHVLVSNWQLLRRRGFEHLLLAWDPEWPLCGLYERIAGYIAVRIPFTRILLTLDIPCRRVAVWFKTLAYSVGLKHEYNGPRGYSGQLPILMCEKLWHRRYMDVEYGKVLFSINGKAWNELVQHNREYRQQQAESAPFYEYCPDCGQNRFCTAEIITESFHLPLETIKHTFPIVRCNECGEQLNHPNYGDPLPVVYAIYNRRHPESPIGQEAA